MKNEKITCIYKITCNVNNRVYIGQTVNFKNRKNSHLYKLNHNIHGNRYLQYDYNLYGKSNFEFSIIERCNKEDLLDKETYYINLYGSKESDKTYNLMDLKGASLDAKRYRKIIAKQIAESHPISIETRLKISKANKGRIVSLESRIKRSNTLRGREFSVETRSKISKNRKGKYTGNTVYTEDFIQKLRDEYKLNPNYCNLGRKYKISDCSVRNLILYGTTSRTEIEKIKNNSCM